MSLNRNKKAQGSNFLQKVISEMKVLLSGVETIDEIENAMEHLINVRMKESFKNGVEVGRKQAARRQRKN